jgi:hypothetical protein
VRPGTRLPTRRRTCSACGRTWPTSVRFCGWCGEALTTPPATGPAPREHGRLGTRRPRVATVIVAGLLIVAATGLGLDWSRAPARVSEPDVGLPAPSELVAPPGGRDGAAAGEDGAGAIPTEALGDGPVCRDGSRVNGCVAWWADVGPSATSSRVVGAHVVVADARGRVRAFLASTGLEAWALEVDAPVRLHAEVAGTVPITDPTTTRFVDLATGSVVGSFDGPVAASASTGPWLLTVESGHVRARSVTGSASWERAIGSSSLAWPTTNAAYLSTTVTLRSDRLTRLVGGNGEDRWSVPLPGRVSGVVGAGNSTVVALDDTGGGAAVVVIDAGGTVLGTHPVSGRVAWITVDQVTGRTAVVTEGGPGASVLVVDTDGGRELARARLDERASGTLPAALRGTEVAVAHAGPAAAITVVGAADGLVRQRIALDGIPRHVELTSDATVVGVTGREVRAWSLATGRLRWRVALGPLTRLLDDVPLTALGDRTLTVLVPDPEARERRRPGRGPGLSDPIGERRTPAPRYRFDRGRTS